MKLKTFCFFSLLFLFSFSIHAQTASSFEDFREKALSETSISYRFDTISKVKLDDYMNDILPEWGDRQIEQHYFFEVFWKDQLAFFFVEESATDYSNSHQILCQCSLDQLEKKFNEIAALKRSLKNYTTPDFNFEKETACLKGAWAVIAKNRDKVIEDMLSGNISYEYQFPEMPSKKIEAELVYDKYGSLFLDANGVLKANNEIASITHFHHLNYIKDSQNKLLFPSSNIPSWMQPLVENAGFKPSRFTFLNPKNGSRSNLNPFAQESDFEGNDWHIRFNLGRDINIQGEITFNAAIALHLRKKEKMKLKRTVPFVSAKEVKILYENGEVKVMSNDENDNRSSPITQSSEWKEVLIYDSKSQLVGQFKNGHINDPLIIYPSENGRYTYEFWTNKLEVVYSPIEVKVKVPEKPAALLTKEKIVFKPKCNLSRVTLNSPNYSLINQGLYASYNLNLPLGYKLDSINSLRIVDSKGKDLLLRQQMKLDEINNQIEMGQTNLAKLDDSWSNGYKVYDSGNNNRSVIFGSYDLPSKEATFVRVKADIKLKHKNKEPLQISIDDTLSISILKKMTPPSKLKKKRSPSNPHRAYSWAIFASQQESSFAKNISAQLPLPKLERGEEFFKVNEDLSVIKALYDDQGHNIIKEVELEVERFKERYKLSNRYSEKKKIGIKTNYDPYQYRPMNAPSIEFYSMLGAIDQASQLYGKAKIAYWVAQKGQQKVKKIPFKWTGKSFIDIEVGDKNIRYDISEVNINNVKYFSFRLNKKETDAYVKSLDFFDKRDVQLNEEPGFYYSSIPNYNARLKEDLINNEMMLEIRYAELELKEENYNFVISLDLE